MSFQSLEKGLDLRKSVAFQSGFLPTKILELSMHINLKSNLEFKLQYCFAYN